VKVLIADDDPVSRRALELTLRQWGYDVLVCADGAEAFEALRQEDAPQLAVLDWMMPGMEGLEVCRMVRELEGSRVTYLILLTAKGNQEDIVAGLEAGADDYVTKPFKAAELKARLRVGLRMMDLQNNLAERVHDLEDALSRVKQLQGLLPICSYCKKVRDDHNYWQQVEGYVAEHSGVQFSHSVCPECYQRYVMPEIEGQRHTPGAQERRLSDDAEMERQPQ
jgi:sigma-B regulation protein RsbU (phosphoserine phosphatase)